MPPNLRPPKLVATNLLPPNLRPPKLLATNLLPPNLRPPKLLPPNLVATDEASVNALQPDHLPNPGPVLKKKENAIAGAEAAAGPRLLVMRRNQMARGTVFAVQNSPINNVLR